MQDAFRQCNYLQRNWLATSLPTYDFKSFETKNCILRVSYSVKGYHFADKNVQCIKTIICSDVKLLTQQKKSQHFL